MKPQKPVTGFCSKNKTKPSVVEVHVSCLLSSNKKAFAFTNYRNAAQHGPGGCAALDSRCLLWRSSLSGSNPDKPKQASAATSQKPAAGTVQSQLRRESLPWGQRQNRQCALKAGRFQCTLPTPSYSCTNNGFQVCFPPWKVNST